MFNFSTFTNYSSSDYNGFRPNADAVNNFGWNSPDFALTADFARPPLKRPFASLAEYSKQAARTSTAFWSITMCSAR